MSSLFDILVISEFFKISTKLVWKWELWFFLVNSTCATPKTPMYICRKLNFVRILCIWLFWKSLTWLVCQKGLTFFKSPRNVSPREAPSGASLGSTFRGLWKSFWIDFYSLFTVINTVLTIFTKTITWGGLLNIFFK